MEDLDLRLVRYFVALAEELHFGRAAARLFISQQTLSAQIAKLESDLGVALLERSGRQARLTPAGQKFVQESRVLLSQARRSIDLVRATDQVVRVASINDRIDTVPQLLDTCQRLLPDLRVETILAPVPEQVHLVQSGELDLALGRAYRVPTGLTRLAFRLDRAHILAPRDAADDPSSDSLPWRALADIGIQVPTIRYAPQLTSFLEELKIDRRLTFRVVPTGSTSLDLSLAQLTRDHVAQLGFDSFRVPADRIIDRLLVEPVALYVWSAIWRSGNTSPALLSFLEVVRAASEEYHWMRPHLMADVWVPAADLAALPTKLTAEVLRGRAVSAVSESQP